jgi:hypothetical protein
MAITSVELRIHNAYTLSWGKQQGLSTVNSIQAAMITRG